jgi:hypothetical protein
MGNLTIGTTFIVLLNVLMWFCTIAMININPTGTFCYNTEGSIIAQVTSTNLTTIDNNVINQLPSAESTTVTAGTTNVFTDIFNNIVNWFKSAPGIKYVYGVVAAPYNILKCTNLPNEFIIGLGTLWWIVSFLVLIAFLWGRD